MLHKFSVRRQRQELIRLHDMQKQNITDEYSCGIYNGLELALAVLEEREPEFVFVDKFVDKKEEPKQMEETKQKGRTVASGIRKLGG